jgi:membrane protease YdiL (CAAX protease family)
MEDVTTTTDGPGPRRNRLLVVAWVTTLLISRLPEVGLREGLGLQTDWMSWALVGAALMLWLASGLVTALHPLRGYFAVMMAVAVVLAVVPVIFGSALWQELASPSSGPMAVLLAERVVLSILALVIIGVVLALGRRLRDAYLGPGDVSARSGVRLPGTKVPLRWSVLGSVWIGILAFLTGLALLGTLPTPIDFNGAWPLFGVAALAALFNSFAEEVMYRAAALSQLAPAIGPGHAVLLLAVWFGLGHFYGGVPAGAVGTVVTGATALLFGRAMIGTGGLAWPWALHFTVDLVIFSGIGLAANALAG